jgi:hypothetical protein
MYDLDSHNLMSRDTEVWEEVSSDIKATFTYNDMIRLPRYRKVLAD